jgi:hypothetical protein
MDKAADLCGAPEDNCDEGGGELRAGRGGVRSLAIKSAVVGYGLVAKEQVGFIVARLLELKEAPKPADAADALAIAICHIHHAQTAAAMRR